MNLAERLVGPTKTLNQERKSNAEKTQNFDTHSNMYDNVMRSKFCTMAFC